MASELLNKTRKINKILQKSGTEPVSFPQLCEILSEVLNTNTYIISGKGKILGAHLTDIKGSLIISDEETGDQKLPEEYTNNIMKVTDTVENITGDKFLEIFKNDIEGSGKFTTIVPIMGSGQRVGSLLLARFDSEFTDEDIVLAEYSATVVCLEILRAKSEEMEEEMRKKAVVQMAIGTLSYSELEAVEHIFNELDGMEGLLVASKIADRVGITRSVIVNALRKFESAGVIESRSLGMKGTHIRILNPKLLDELNKIKK
ncbi:MAG: GTP-sensing pleiotropic transcriptional regulator CodY [Tepidibacter sp.]|jgi:transcriptional pleiotropic repressor|uniref:GTP-sensing pleiotropic transcriptional regulator CodY n=1 Tax=Tepidibacter sp. TaxID=2529387 RepID=UPI0025DA328D|nr:GTP-sensing pleiotropic transcriptional regulator CodY [Tepidibacter sp.]MCT4509783.1 GTP-sensing pleiotropic transcriptional regulator CodY [Tepidibacter sp.]